MMGAGFRGGGVGGIQVVVRWGSRGGRVRGIQGVVR